MRLTNNSPSIEDQLDDLATGQLGRFASWRLQLRIRRDPDLTRKWAEVQALRSALIRIVPSPATAVQTAPFHKFALPHAGGRSALRQRATAFAIGGAILLSITGAVASRYWAGETGYSLSFPGGDCGGVWTFRGKFRGNIDVVSPSGHQAGRMALNDTQPTQNSLEVIYTNQNHRVATATVKGLGRHPIYNPKGVLMGYVILTAFQAKDIKRMKDERNQTRLDFAAYYKHPERVTSTGTSGQHYYCVLPLPGLVGDEVTEALLAANGQPGHFEQRGVAWKTYGDVHVRMKYRAPAESFPASKVEWRKDTPGVVHLPERTIIDEAESSILLTTTEIAKLSPDSRALYVTENPQAHPVPETFWSIADPSAEIDQPSGTWRHVRQKGTFHGYGHFVVRDKDGKTVMTLDVTRPTSSGRLSGTLHRDILSPQKVVPGWDGEE